MCDTIIMPNGTEITSINRDGTCLCTNSQNAILGWIINHIDPLEINDKLEIVKTPFGWEVSTGEMG